MKRKPSCEPDYILLNKQPNRIPHAHTPLPCRSPLEPEPSVILVVGTLAFDEIASTRDTLPADNVKLTDWHTHFGGCGGNVAWNLARLGIPHRLFGYLGENDADAYLRHLGDAGANTDTVKRIRARNSARAFIATDPRGHQFTAFQPLEVPLEQFVGDLDATLDRYRPEVAIIAPDVPERMLAAMQRLQGICSRVCYPGQYTLHFERRDLERLFAGADLVFQNAHEHASRPAPDSCMTVVTAGAEPVRVRTGGHESTFPVPTAAVIDPTGCGDAFAAAFTAAWSTGASVAAACAAGTTQAQRCLAVHGSQCH